MKKTLLLLTLLAILISDSAVAQTDVHLKINHKMDGSAFAFNQNTQTPDGYPFKFRRLEYYMSGFSLIHDGGQETKVPNTWLLIDVSVAVNVLLGNFNITNLEEIRFAIGVEKAYNHLDPASYAPGHPLAPKSPSMHWGWQAGYRFVALEGSGGPNRDKNVEIHSLGDRNYRQIKINTTGNLSGSDLTIELNADYTQALAGIETEAGLITHAEVEEAEELAMNFVYHVFTSSEGNGSALFNSKIAPSNALLYPNPSQGSSKLVLMDGMIPASVMVFDQQGKCVDSFDTQGEEIVLKTQTPGFYLITLEYTNQEVHTLKWVVSP